MFSHPKTHQTTEIPLFTYQQLAAAGDRTKIRTKALNLRDLVGEDQVPPLVATGSLAATILWILQSQVHLQRAMGDSGASLKRFGWEQSIGTAEEGCFGPEPDA